MTKLAALKPFFNKFENLSPRKRNFFLTKMDVFQKDRADFEGKRSKCLKVIVHAEKEFEMRLLYESDGQLIRVINKNLENRRCEKCARVLQVGECHCHHYFCKRCYNDNVCGGWNKLFAYPPEIIQFQYFF